MARDFGEYLRLLDDSDFICQINSLSQTAKRTQLANLEDPFDDSLDEILLAKATSETPEFENKEVEFREAVRGLHEGSEILPSDLDLKRPVTHELRDDANPPNLPDNLGHQSSDEDVLYGDVGTRHGFGEYGTYFANKHRKQDLLDQEYVKWETNRHPQKFPPVFKDCIIHVNGFTDPPIAEIHRLVVLYGGKFLLYLSKKSAATHIICDKLTPRKSIQFQNYKVVKTQWLLDLIDRLLLQNWQSYRLISEVDYGQQRLHVNGEAGKITNETLIATHPHFLRNFFANLRLHHLSTWKADLRLNFLRQCRKIDRPVGFAPPVILHIDFDSFFVAALAAQYPQYNITRDALVVSHGGDTLDIALCNYVARKFGVKNGMWLHQARKKCPDIKVIDYNFDAYEKISNRFYSYLLRLGMDVVYPVSIDEVLVDASHYIAERVSLTEEAVHELADKVRKDVLQLSGGCTVLVGVSKNVLLAKLALRKAKPDGKFLLIDKDEHELIEFLRGVKVESLPGIGRSICLRLKEICKRSEPMVVPDLRLIDRDTLTSHFGHVTGQKLFEYARGIDPQKLEILPEALGRKLVSVDVNYGIRFREFSEVDDFLMRLAGELSDRLRKLGFNGLSLTLKLARRAVGAPVNPPKFLGMGHVDFALKSSRLGVATDQPGIIGLEMKALFRMLNVPILDLRGVAVTMANLIEGKDKQATLDFSAPLETKKRLPPSDITDEIDWEVFEALPEDIKREISSELGRRGLSLSPKLKYVSRKNLPVKGGKAYKQQLISPSKAGRDYVRVVESPTKASKTTVLLPVKPNLPFDIHSLVLNELPQDIQDEIMEEMDRQKLPRKRSRPAILKITQDWLATCHRKFETPRFYDFTSNSEIKELIKQWVALSMEQCGPHEDDIDRMEHFLESLIESGYQARAQILKQWICKCLSVWEVTESSNLLVRELLDVWKQVLEEWTKKLGP